MAPSPLRIILAVAFLLALPAGATTFIVPSDEQLFEKSGAVVVGTVGSVDHRPAGRFLLLSAELLVEEVLKGALEPGASIVAETPAADRRTGRREIHGAPHLRPGTRVLLFLFEWEPGRWAVVDLAAGKFEFARDDAGRDVLVREEGEITGWDASMRPWVEQRREAAGFLGHLRRLGRGEKPEHRDYVIDARPLQALSGETVSTPDGGEGMVTADAVVPPATNYLMYQGGTNFRWNQFPTPAIWRWTTVGAAVAGADAALTAAAAGWTNDCGSNITLTNGGTTSSTAAGLAGSEDGQNTVRWEVDLAAINDFTCSGSGWSGVLGMGGPNGFGSTHTYEATTYWTITEADVDMNRGLAACTAVPQRVKNAALMHEIGHGLNFRHSDKNRQDNGACALPLPCSNYAVMRASLPAELDAVPQQWDIDAARAVYPGGTCGTPIPPPPLPPPPPAVASREDFNGDGWSDLLFRRPSTGENVVWFMHGATRLEFQNLLTVPGSQWTLAATGDFNRDNRPDILWRNQSSGQNVVWFMNGPSRTGLQSILSVDGSQWEIEGAADFDRNGTDDIVWRNQSTGQNVLWLMSGTSRLTYLNLLSVPGSEWRIGGTGDFDANGSPDIVWRNYSTGQNVIWFMSGTNRSSYANILAVQGAAWRISAVADYDGDGRADIVWRNASTGENVVWYMAGPSRRAYANLLTVSDTSWIIAAPK